jgi:hypothetical protein
MKKLIAIIATTLTMSANAASITGYSDYYQAENVGNGNINLYTSCGAVAVGFSNIEVNENMPDAFIGRDPNVSVVIMDSKGRKIVLKNQLSDYNRTVCLADRNKIVLGSVCGGSRCGDAYTHHVIDTKQMKIITPKQGVSDEQLPMYMK